jgi:hypothetical protein
MSNGLAPDLLTPTERIAEIGALLAAGLIRLHTAQSSQKVSGTGDCFVDCAPDQSGHATALNETEEGA